MIDESACRLLTALVQKVRNGDDFGPNATKDLSFKLLA